jgi:hypothetical protein
MRQMLEEAIEYGVSTLHIFIDFKAAYDTINREKLLEAMNQNSIGKSNYKTCKMYS